MGVGWGWRGAAWPVEDMVEGVRRAGGDVQAKGEGMPFIHLFIHPHSSSLSLLLLFAALKSDGGGGAHGGAQCDSVQWEKGVRGVPRMPFSLKG